jgi:hypothetical protein
VLHATITLGGGLNGTYALAATTGTAWQFTGRLGTCLLGQINLTCLGDGTWQLTAAGPSFYSPSAATCTPLSLTFPGVDLTGCGGSAGATITVTV